MGQYYNIVNLDKKEFLNPHKFGDGAKLREFGCSASGTMTALAILLAVGNGLGGGDLRSDNPIIGSWAGDRIAVVGDYVEESEDVYNYKDVSDHVIAAMEDDESVRQEMRESWV